MILDNILAAFIGFGVAILIYLAITQCVNEYKWRKMKRHVVEAIEAMDLWDSVNSRGLTHDMFLSITTFLDDHKYKHWFNEHAGAFWLMHMLVEIRNEHEHEVGNAE